jgi:hypothetical protein
MTETRPTALHTHLAHRDAPAALDRLQRAFGIEVTMRWADDGGGIQPAEPGPPPLPRAPPGGRRVEHRDAPAG